MNRRTVKPGLAAATAPIRAIIYLRLSDLRDDDLDETGAGATFSDREQELRDFADELGWDIAEVIIENDVSSRDGKHRNASAFKRRVVTLPDGTTGLRVVRPGFRKVLRMFADGTANGLLVEELERITRDPRDGCDLLDVAEMRKVNARSLSGTLTLTDGGTDAEITAFRDAVNRANASSRDTSRRVRRGRRRKARRGEFGGGRRPFGFEPDGVTVRPAEADVIADCDRRLLEGVSLKQLARDLCEAGVPSVTGRPWRAETLRCILLRQRNAGRVVYLEEVISHEAPWKPLVDPEVHDRVVALLTDPSRRTNADSTPGVSVTWLGSGLFGCGPCELNGTVSKVSVTLARKSPRYRCRAANHLARDAMAVNRYVEAALLERLSQPDAVDLLMPPRPDVDVTRLRARAAAIRHNLMELAEDRALGLIDREAMLAASRVAKREQVKIEAALAEATIATPLGPLVNVNDVEAEWNRPDFPMGSKRAILDAVMTVTILRTSRAGRTFDPDAIHIEWKVGAAA